MSSIYAQSCVASCAILIIIIKRSAKFYKAYVQTGMFCVLLFWCVWAALHGAWAIGLSHMCSQAMQVYRAADKYQIFGLTKPQRLTQKCSWP